MKFLRQRRGEVGASASPYRVVEQDRGEIAWVNRFLDMQRVRGLNEFSLRYYGHLRRQAGDSGAHRTTMKPTEYPLQKALEARVPVTMCRFPPALQSPASAADATAVEAALRAVLRLMDLYRQLLAPSGANKQLLLLSRRLTRIRSLFAKLSQEPDGEK